MGYWLALFFVWIVAGIIVVGYIRIEKKCDRDRDIRLNRWIEKKLRDRDRDM